MAGVRPPPHVPKPTDPTRPENPMLEFPHLAGGPKTAATLDEARPLWARSKVCTAVNADGHRWLSVLYKEDAEAGPPDQRTRLERLAWESRLMADVLAAPPILRSPLG